MDDSDLFHSKRAAKVWSAMLFLAFQIVSLAGPTKASAAWLFEDVDRGIISLGGRATYFDSNEGDANWFGGGQLRLYLGKIFALEASADYRTTDFGSSTRVDTYPVQTSALIFLLPGNRLSPFLVGGGGWYFTNVEGPGGFHDNQDRFGLHAGGGLQLMLDRHWSVDSTYRYIWLEKVQSRDQNLLDKQFEDSGHMITIGLNYHFG